MNPTVNSTEEPIRMSCLQQLTPIKKGLIALGVLAFVAVAVILGVTLPNSNNPDKDERLRRQTKVIQDF